MDPVCLVMPILPGKKNRWLEMMEKIRGPWGAMLKASRKAAGVRERTFLQETPMGDLVIVTLEGADPVAALGQMMTDQSEASREMMAMAAEVHGFDMKAAGPLPTPNLIFDTE